MQRALTPSQQNRRAARRMISGLASSVGVPCIGSRLKNQCVQCLKSSEAAIYALRAVLRRTIEPDLREFCRAALEELRGK
jgi:hypothetical protein